MSEEPRKHTDRVVSVTGTDIVKWLLVAIVVALSLKTHQLQSKINSLEEKTYGFQARIISQETDQDAAKQGGFSLVSGQDHQSGNPA